MNKKLSDLIPDHANANKGTQRGRAALESSLRRYGAGRSILVDRNGRIIAGNKTAEVASDIGMDNVIVVQTDGTQIIAVQRTDLDIDSETGRGLAYADNRVGELSLDWDAEQVLADLDAGVNLSGLFDKEELDELLSGLKSNDDVADAEPQVDRAEELRQKWGVEPGQLWQLGEHRLICGDCTDAAVVARVMGGERAALCFTSPPYADMRDYKGNDVSPDALVGFVPLAIGHSDYQVVNLGLKFADGEVVPWWEVYQNEFKGHGQKLLAWNVWDKQGQVSIAAATNMFYITHEWLFVFGTSPKKLNRIIPNDLAAYRSRFGDNFLRGIDNNPVRQKDGSTKVTTSSTYTHHQLHSVYAQTPELGSIRSAHPATFPVGLPAAYVLSMTDNGDLIYEPFSGSGTTLIACENLGRRCRAVEIAPAYVAVALERWAAHTGKMPAIL